MPTLRGKYTVSAEGVSVTDATQFFQLVGGTGACVEILEIRVFQTSDTALAMNALHIERGTGGAGGTARTEDEHSPDGPAAIASASDGSPTTEVTGVDMNIRVGWNILQEAVWLPTPELQLWLKQNDDLAISLATADTLTIGYTITWNEYDA